jgi:hypothetical protein
LNCSQPILIKRDAKVAEGRVFRPENSQGHREGGKGNRVQPPKLECNRKGSKEKLRSAANGPEFIAIFAEWLANFAVKCFGTAVLQPQSRVSAGRYLS